MAGNNLLTTIVVYHLNSIIEYNLKDKIAA